MTGNRAPSWRVGVDTGGTFTDLVAVGPDGATLLRKVSSTPSAPSQAVFEALGRTGVATSDDLDRFVLGTTIATNAVIQRRGAPVVLLTTAGFEDVLYIQRIDRPGVYDLQWVKAVPYAVRRMTVGVRERTTAEGALLHEVDEPELARVVGKVRALLAAEPSATVAVSFLFSYLNDSNEAKLAVRLRQEFPDTPISLSSEVAPVWREYERSSTTVMDAYVHRVIKAFASELREGLTDLGIQDRTALMKSNGGQVPLAHAADRSVDMILSGLAGGMIAGHFWAGRVGTSRAVTLDMGGTSADIGVVIDGQLQFSGLFEVEWGVPITLPIIDVTTIGAGGSSIAAIDYGGLLRVGPESAGADPGPAAYGRGGDQPTVTDANIVLGRLDPSSFLGGELPLDPARAAVAVDTIATGLGLSTEEAAEAIVAVSVENMTGAVRLVTVDRGHDYREFDLIAFGGAGPLHAAQIADHLGMARAVIPPAPGLVSAFGALIADERLDRRVTLVRQLHRDDGRIAETLNRLARSATDELAHQIGRQPSEITVHTSISCRYVGQNYEQEVRTYRGHVDKSFELAIPVDPGDRAFARTVGEGFHAAHEAAYGYSLPDQAIETVYLQATAVIPGRPVPLRPYSGEGERRTRTVWTRSLGAVDATVVDRSALEPGEVVAGPAVVVEPTSTTWVPEGFVAAVDPDLCLILTRAPAATAMANSRQADPGGADD